MLANNNNVLTDLIANAQYPVVVFFFSEGCENEPTKEQKDIENAINNNPNKVLYYTWCIAENVMPVPRIATALYYFLPGNQNAVFWRMITPNMGDITNILNNDLNTLTKMFTQNISYEEARFTPQEREKIEEVENFLGKEKEVLHTFPSSFQMARNLAKEVWKAGKAAASGLPVIVSTEIGLERLTICESCDNLDKENYRCSSCGCFMKAKTQLATASCPIGKWEAVL